VLNYGENGLLVNITSAIEIADAIKRLIYDSDLYKKLSLKGLKYVEENFTDLKCAEKLLNVIEEVRMNEL
jgi:glycosyltransferase involved in cell wall biosynthesis